ncbi:MAG: enoyl-CoA hydratase/isomerase family protein [Deltaproteobacteria bacterium]|jgi:enoyl-CoA hydratase|nr:enoyl-CoA hydratase/isomerase family protein [Deltaproteobacteria bacterium]MBW2536050.1 enoyl-CoA hydratase/isomerase family protein [Deltaproteobacteria bacterium]
MTSRSPLAVQQQGSTLVLTIARPGAKNAINRELAERLRDAVLDAADDEGIRCLVLAARGEDVFVAGGDLKEFRTLPLDGAGAQHILDLGTELSCIEDSPLPIIAAVQGDVLGGGCELLVLCDLVVMEEQAAIEFRHVRMGLTPAWGGTSRLVERVGALRATDLLLTGRRVAADEASTMGLVNQVVPRGGSLTAALDLARQIAHSERDAVAAIKRSLTTARRAARADGLTQEQKVFRSAWGSAAHRAAMAAFLSKH